MFTSQKLCGCKLINENMFNSLCLSQRKGKNEWILWISKFILYLFDKKCKITKVFVWHEMLPKYLVCQWTFYKYLFKINFKMEIKKYWNVLPTDQRFSTASHNHLWFAEKIFINIKICLVKIIFPWVRIPQSVVQFDQQGLRTKK